MEKILLHPLPVRIWHWINAVGFLLLIATGLQIRYAGLIDWMRFETAVSLHNKTGFVLIANFFVWLGFYLLSERIRVYHAELDPAKHFRESFRQLRYYAYGMFLGERNPHQASIYHKFNPLQAMTYQLVMFLLVPVQFATGVLLWDISRFHEAVEMLGGVRVVDTVHVLVFIAFVGYVIVHAYLAALGRTPGAHFKAMITGFEDEEPEQKPASAG